MALSPLVVSAQDPSGNLLGGAFVEVRNRVRPAMAVVVYDASGFALSSPYTTEADGEFTGWLVNGSYEYRVAKGSTVSAWRPFRAYAGVGAEGFYESAPVGQATPTSSTITIPSHGVADLIGGAEVAVDFSHDHLLNVQIMLLRSSEALLLTNVIVPSAELGMSLEVEYRNAITGASPTIYDSGGSVITPPYMTNSGTGIFEGYARRNQGIVQWRIPASTTGYENYSAGYFFTLGGVQLFDGFSRLSSGAGDQAFDGTLIFTTQSGDWDSASPLVDGQRIGIPAGTFRNNSIGAGDDWTLAIADLAATTTTGHLDAWSFELIPA